MMQLMDIPAVEARLRCFSYKVGSNRPPASVGGDGDGMITHAP